MSSPNPGASGRAQHSTRHITGLSYGRALQCATGRKRRQWPAAQLTQGKQQHSAGRQESRRRVPRSCLGPGGETPLSARGGHSIAGSAATAGATGGGPAGAKLHGCELIFLSRRPIVAAPGRPPTRLAPPPHLSVPAGHQLSRIRGGGGGGGIRMRVGAQLPPGSQAPVRGRGEVAKHRPWHQVGGRCSLWEEAAAGSQTKRDFKWRSDNVHLLRSLADHIFKCKSAAAGSLSLPLNRQPSSVCVHLWHVQSECASDRAP
jgi:hypothetical protein